MQTLLGLISYEYRMAIRRWGMWLAFGIVYLFNGIEIFGGPAGVAIPSGSALWQYAGQMAYMWNLFFPLVAGISAADRFYRDERLRMRELQSSTPLRSSTYILGKYLGVFLAVITPLFLFALVIDIANVLTGQVPLSYLYPASLAFLTISVPAFLFVTAFSLACPLVMPLRVYQVLFTGYWFWGNFLNPQAFPTLSETLLTPGGKFAFDAFFGGFSFAQEGYTLYTPLQAVLNWVVLAACIVAVLFALQRYQVWQAKRA